MDLKKNIKNRYHILDEFRGFLLLNMIAYHMLWDLVYMYGMDIEWYKGNPGYIWQQCICHGFILLSGFCWKMGKKPFARGLIVFGAGLLITMVTLLVVPSAQIIFGVLTFIGSAMLLVIPLSKLLNKVHPGIGVVTAFLLFLIFRPINDGYLGIGDTVLIQLPDGWYFNLFTSYLGFPAPGFWSTDYFSIFPWIFLYITGYYGYTILKKKEWFDWARNGICSPLRFIGRYSLFFYLIHQPIVYGICRLVFGY